MYNPIYSVESLPFTVYFEPAEERGEQERNAKRVIAHLGSLSRPELVEQSIQFYKWLVLYRISTGNLLYAERLLAYFHQQGLLLCKRCVNCEEKQSTKRYLVLYTIDSGIRKHVFSKTYNSIREIQADTGKKPSQIQCQRSRDLMCKILK